MRTTALAAMLLLGLPLVSWAHGVQTHVNLLRSAVDFLAREDPRFACSADFLFEQLRPGVRFEDEYEDPACTDDPLRGQVSCAMRFNFHFYPALRDMVFTTCSSRQWGFDRGRSCEQTYAPRYSPMVNVHTWDHAMENRLTISGWRQLGWVLHLLQDLTSPAHVRNDAHPALPTEVGVLGNPDPLEIPGGNYNLSRTYPASLMRAEIGLVDLPSPEQYMDVVQRHVQRFLQLRRPGIRRFGRDGSDGGLEHVAIRARAEDEHYFTGVTSARGPDRGEPRIASYAVRSSRSRASERHLRRAATDEGVARDQRSVVAPLAIQHASLIRHTDTAPRRHCPAAR
jgi:hypothetical protein